MRECVRESEIDYKIKVFLNILSVKISTRTLF